jgi:hypothetical protein
LPYPEPITQPASPTYPLLASQPAAALTDCCGGIGLVEDCAAFARGLSAVDLGSATVVPYSGGTPAIINEMMGKRVGLVFEAY